MKFLLIHKSMSIGGIETLIIRFSQWAILNNHSVELLLKEGGDCVHLLNKNVKVIFMQENYEILKNPRSIKNIKKLCKIDIMCDVVITFQGESLWIGSNIVNIFNLKVKLVSGIYTPWDYKFSLFPFTFHKVVSKYFRNKFPDSNKFFMSEQVKHSNEKLLRKKMPESSIWPLPIEARTICDFHKRSQKKIIVSIGRLVPFKSYNIYMIDVMIDILKKGFDVEWHVYGDGELKEIMENKIKNSIIENKVYIKKNLSYNEVPNVLKNATIFIGMGTSLIEAASYGVPGITAVVNEENPLTYGYLYELPYYACGERLDFAPNKEISNLIINLLSMDDNDYFVEQQKHVEYVKNYSCNEVMSDFCEKLNKLEKVSDIKMNIYDFYCSNILKLLYKNYEKFKS